jgi:hypothetical protein
MRARSFNIRRRATVALIASLALSCTLAGCGGSSKPVATVLLRDTFDAHTQIERGKVNLDLSLSGTGSSALSRPLALKVSGPFEELGEGKLPSFDLKIDVETDGNSLDAGAVSYAGRIYVELEGGAFVVPKSASASLEKSFAEASKSAGGGQGSFSALGIEPGRWLTHPVVKGEPTVGGVKTTEIEGGLDLKALLEDTSRLTGEAGSTGLGGAGGELSPELVTELAKSVSSATIDVYTGNSDHLLRRLTLDASIAPEGKAKAALGGLKTAKLKLDLGFEDLGQQQQITAPSNPKPLSQLVKVLEGIGLVGQQS